MGESFAALLGGLLGLNHTGSVYGAVNPLEFAPAPVGTEAILKPKQAAPEPEKAPAKPEKKAPKSEKTQAAPKEQAEASAAAAERGVRSDNEKQMTVERAAEQGKNEPQAVPAAEAAAKPEKMPTALPQTAGENAMTSGDHSNARAQQQPTAAAVTQEPAPAPAEQEASASSTAASEAKSATLAKNQAARPELQASAPQQPSRTTADEPLLTVNQMPKPQLAAEVRPPLQHGGDGRGADLTEALRNQVAAMIRGEGSAESAAAAAKTAGHGSGPAVIAGLDGKGEAGDAANKAKAASKLQRMHYSDQDKIVAQVKDMLKSAQSQNGNTLVMTLDPPDLGSMTVRVTSKNGQIFARVIPESPEVEAALKNRAPELVQVLAVNGINLNDVHVSIGAEISESEMYEFSRLLQDGGGQFESRQDGERSSGGNASAGRGDGDLPRGDLAAKSGRRQHAPPEVPGWVA